MSLKDIPDQHVKIKFNFFFLEQFIFRPKHLPGKTNFNSHFSLMLINIASLSVNFRDPPTQQIYIFSKYQFIYFSRKST